MVGSAPQFSKRVGLVAISVLVVTGIVLNLLKAVPLAVHDLGWPYWELTYRNGFIKRGLVGTIFQFFAQASDGGAQRQCVIVLHSLAVGGLVVTLLLWAAEAARRGSPRTRWLVVTGAAAFLLAELIPTLWSVVGYLDIVLFVVTVAAARAAARGHVLPAGAIAAIGPFVHEAFFFLWLPVLVLAFRPEPGSTLRGWLTTLRSRAPLLSPFASTLFVLACQSPSATRRSIAELAVDAGVKNTMDQYQFGLSTSAALAIMRGKFIAFPGQFGLACVVFLPSALVIALCAISIDHDRSRLRKVGVVVAATLAPCTILLVAWDLSRFLLWATFGALLGLLANARRANDAEAEPTALPSIEATSRATLVWTTSALLLLSLYSTRPHMYAYFETTSSHWSLAPPHVERTPGAQVAAVFLRHYNATLYEGSFAMQPDCKVEPYVATRSKDACAFTLNETGSLVARPLMLTPGRYVLTVATTRLPECPDPKAFGALLVYYRGVRTKATSELTEPETRIPFTIDDDDAAFGRVRARVDVPHGCLLVRDLRVDPAP